MKKLLASVVLVLGSLSLSSVALADIHFVPQVGYQFQNTTSQKDRQERDLGSYQQNQATFGVAVLTDVSDKTQLGVEYLRVNANNNSDQIGFVVNQDIGKGFYLLGSAGYYKMDTKYPVFAETGVYPDGSTIDFYDTKTKKAFSSPYVTVGAGYKYPITNVITLKTEVRGQYITDKDYFNPQALVGFDFNLNQISKPFSYK